MSVVTLTISPESYKDDYNEPIYKKDGSEDGSGIDFGDIETGIEYPPRWLWIRHDGLEPVYNASYYIRTIGTNWGGYVADREDAHIPYNPNWFRSGGKDPDTDLPRSSTVDYEFMRNIALNNEEMGARVHYDREDDTVRTSGLGYDNKGLNFSAIKLTKVSLDYSGTDAEEKDGYIYPEPDDENKIGTSGDEARLGLSIKIPEDIEGSGHVQFSFAIKYRYTS